MSSIRKPETVSVSLFAFLSNGCSEYTPKKSVQKTKESAAKKYPNWNNNLNKDLSENIATKEKSIYRKNLDLIGNMTIYNLNTKMKPKRPVSKNQNKGRQREARSKHEERMKKARQNKTPLKHKPNSSREISVTDK